MIDKFALYRVIFPFRCRLQSRLREERRNVNLDVFERGFGGGDRHGEIPRLMWEMLRAKAFVPDFRPDPGDSLSTVYAMGPEEVRDDLIEPLLTTLGLSPSGFDFTGFDFSSIATPKDASELVLKIADAQRVDAR